MTHRIDHIDGLRGLAILLVVSYHIFVHWENVLPYGDYFAENMIFNLGWLGVQLFFIISGFVILLSLEKSKSCSAFLVKRWLRLFPAMAICSAVIFSTAWLIPERPFGQPKLIDLLPGLTFIDDRWWSLAVGQTVRPLEGVFWTLYVEVKFYIFAALIHYRFGRKAVFYCVLGTFLISILIHLAAGISDHTIATILLKISNSLAIEHFGWFACGAAFFLYYDSSDIRWCYAGLLTAAVSSLFLFRFNWFAVFPFSLSLLFLLALRSHFLQQLLSNRLIVFVGFISYPLYLLHENMMVGLIVKTGNIAPSLPYWLYPVAPFVLVCFLSYLVARFGEPYIRDGLRNASFIKRLLK